MSCSGVFCIIDVGSGPKQSGVFRRTEQVKVTPGSRLEVTDCVDTSDGGITGDVRLADENYVPFRVEEEPLTIW